MDLSVVIPCYDEERRLPGSLEQLREYLAAQSGSLEFVLVDDGSTDATLAVMQREARRHPGIRVVVLPANRGKGRAVAEGVRVTTGDLVLITDADLSTPIHELPGLRRALTDGADVGFGSRAARGAREIDQPLHRRVMGRLFNLLVRAALLPGICDTQCGFKLFSGPVARELFADLRIDGFAFDVEVLWRARLAGYRIQEIPVRWRNSEATRVSPVRHSVQMLRDLLWLRLLQPGVMRRPRLGDEREAIR